MDATMQDMNATTPAGMDVLSESSSRFEWLGSANSSSAHLGLLTQDTNGSFTTTHTVEDNPHGIRSGSISNSSSRTPKKINSSKSHSGKRLIRVKNKTSFKALEESEVFSIPFKDDSDEISEIQITYSDMQALLEPICSSLDRMDHMLTHVYEACLPRRSDRPTRRTLSNLSLLRADKSSLPALKKSVSSHSVGSSHSVTSPRTPGTPGDLQLRINAASGPSTSDVTKGHNFPDAPETHAASHPYEQHMHMLAQHAAGEGTPQACIVPKGPRLHCDVDKEKSAMDRLVSQQKYHIPVPAPPPEKSRRINPNSTTAERLINNLDNKGASQAVKATATILQHRHVKQVLKGRFQKDTSHNEVTPVLIEKTLQWWTAIREPKEKNCCRVITESRIFETICMVLIIFNSILVAFTTNWQMQHIQVKEVPFTLAAMEGACLVLFFIELVMRLLAHKRYFFINDDMHWNILDFMLVSISTTVFIMEHLVGVDHGKDVMFMRLLRLLKLSRIFRSLRSLRFFSSLTLLLESFQKSFNALFWGLLMLAFVLYLFALLFMQGLIEHLNMQDNVDNELSERIVFYFGSLGTTCLSLYMAVTGGDDWRVYYDLISSVSPLHASVFILYVFVFLFAIVNILTALLVEKAMAASKPDAAETIMRRREAQAEEVQHFLKVCQAMDKDSNGVIHWHEFEDWLCNPVMLAYMSTIGIEVHDVQNFFHMVSAHLDGSGEHQDAISIEHFVERCMHMKGTATAIDMQRALYQNSLMHHDLRSIEGLLSEKLHHIEHMLHHACVGH